MAGETLALTFGSIARDVREELEDFQEFIDYLNERASELGVDHVDMYVARSQDDMIENLQSGRVDRLRRQSSNRRPDRTLHRLQALPASLEERGCRISHADRRSFG